MREIHLTQVPQMKSLLADLTYKEAPYWYGATRRALHLDIVAPKKKQAQPCLVWFCGGAFQQMDYHLWVPELMYFADRGMTVVSVEYRVGVTGLWPAAVEDAWDALDYLNRNAQDFCIDPDRIFVMGESAGGYLAAALGVGLHRPEHGVSVRGVVNLYGVTSMTEMEAFERAHGHSSVLTNMGGTAADNPERYRDADICAHVAGCRARFLTMHGKADQRVPCSVSESLHRSLCGAGCSSELILADDAIHGDPRFYSDESKEIMYRFMREEE